MTLIGSGWRRVGFVARMESRADRTCTAKAQVAISCVGKSVKTLVGHFFSTGSEEWVTAGIARTIVSGAKI